MQAAPGFLQAQAVMLAGWQLPARVALPLTGAPAPETLVHTNMNFTGTFQPSGTYIRHHRRTPGSNKIIFNIDGSLILQFWLSSAALAEIMTQDIRCARGDDIALHERIGVVRWQFTLLRATSGTQPENGRQREGTPPTERNYGMREPNRYCQQAHEVVERGETWWLDSGTTKLNRRA